LTDLSEIAAGKPAIVDAAVKNGVCEVQCFGGVLEVVVAYGCIRLDSGCAVSLDELTAVVDGYWREWKEHWERVGLKKEAE
jgi:hypothetical protein